jgi:hypothetical protein
MAFEGLQAILDGDAKRRGELRLLDKEVLIDLLIKAESEAVEAACLRQQLEEVRAASEVRR